MRGPIPPNINGLLYFIHDASTLYSIEEQNNLSSSYAGQQLKESYNKCIGHSKQLHNARLKLKQYIEQIRSNDTTTSPQQQQQQHPNDNDQHNRGMIIHDMKQEIQKHEMKYRSCLSYMLCPIAYQQYTKCWDEQIRKFSHDELQEYEQDGTLQVVCQMERDAIEYCVGTIVSNAVLAAGTTTDP